MNRYRRARPRRGAIVQESVTAILITTVVLASVVHLLSLINDQRRAAHQRAWARHGAENLIEDAMSRPWPQLTAEQMSTASPSQQLRSLMPDSRVDIQVIAEDSSDTVRRIQVQIEWPAAVARRVAPVRLVAWRYRTEEPSR